MYLLSPFFLANLIIGNGHNLVVYLLKCQQCLKIKEPDFLQSIRVFDTLFWRLSTPHFYLELRESTVLFINSTLGAACIYTTGKFSSLPAAQRSLEAKDKEGTRRRDWKEGRERRNIDLQGRKKRGITQEGRKKEEFRGKEKEREM